MPLTNFGSLYFFLSQTRALKAKFILSKSDNFVKNLHMGMQISFIARKHVIGVPNPVRLKLYCIVTEAGTFDMDTRGII